MYDDKKRRDIRLLLAAEVPLERVAKLTGVSLSTVQRVGKEPAGQGVEPQPGVLFHVLNDRCLRRRPMVLTTNKPLAAWGAVLHDDDLAAAILDRLLDGGLRRQRGRVVTLGGPSMRTRHLEGPPV